MDDELSELANMFSSLQEQETRMRLSEANCVELINKLTRSGVLDQLIYTLDGSEYVTVQQLEKEIVEEVGSCGRIELVKLHSLLNVDLEFVERAAKRLLEQGIGNMRLVDGELISERFLESICLEIEEMLQLQNELSLPQLIARFSFSSELIQGLVTRNLGIHIHGLFEDGVLYTENFVRREQSKLRGALQAITVPTGLSKILPGMKRKLFYSCLDSLVHGGAVSGIITGKRGTSSETFVPQVYVCLAQRFIASFYLANGFVSLERAIASLGAEQGVTFLKKRFPNGLLLPTCFVERGIVEQLEAHVDEVVGEASDAALVFVDVEPLLPACLTEEDTEKVIALCTTKSVACLQLVGGRFLIGSRLMQDAQVKLKPLVDEAVAAYTEKLAAASEQHGKKGKAIVASDFMTMDMCTKRLTALSNKKCEPELIDLLCEGSFGRLIQAAEEAAAKVVVAVAPVATSSDEKLQQAKLDFVQFWLNYSLFKSGLVLFEGSLLATAEKHLVKSSGLSLTRCLLEIATLVHHFPIVESSETMLKHLPLKTVSTLAPLLQAATSGECACVEFEALLSAAVAPFKLTVAPPDAKTRRGLVQAHRQVFLQQLETQTVPSLVLHLAVVTLVAFRKEFVLNIPSSLLPAVIQSLNETLDGKVLDALRSEHIDVEIVKSLCLANLKKGATKK
jgi:hypothetical protein